MYGSLNLLTPWFTLGIVLFLLIRVQFWIHQHLFGMGYLASNEKSIATILYLVALMPGVFLREFSRYMVAGMFRVRPVYITVVPQVGDDGIVDIRFIHFLVVNPFYAALIGVTPFLAGMGCVVLISHSMLDIQSFIRAIGTTPNAFREALLALLGRPYFLLWVYILFGIANTMLPTTSELRSSWIFWVIVALFVGLLLVIGLPMVVFRLLAGPVTTLLYALAAVFGAVLVFDLIVGTLIWLAEGIIGRLTNRRVAYRPEEKPVKAARGALPEPSSVYDVRLPIPLPPGKGLPAGAQSSRLGTGQVAEKQPALPARAVGTDLPAVPEKILPPAAGPLRAPTEAPKPALGTPGRQTSEFRPGQPAQPAAPPLATPGRQTGESKPAFGAPKPDTAAQPPKPPPLAAPGRQTGAASSPFSPAARQSGESTSKPAAPPLATPGRQTSESKPVFGAPKPIGGPPAVPKPATIDPARKTGLPVPPPQDRPARPAPKPFSQPTGARSPSHIDDNDYIDADVIDEEVEVDDEAPTPPQYQSKPPSNRAFPAINQRDSSEAKQPAKPPGKSPGSLFAKLSSARDDEKKQEDDKKDDDDDDLKYVGIDEV